MTRLERLSHIAQVVSAVAVVVSIVYLALQIRSNTRLVRYEATVALKELQHQVDQWERDSSHVEMVMRGDPNPASLSPVEWAQYARRWTNRHNVWALAHTGQLEGTLPLAEWEAWDRSYSGSACVPGRLRVWEERRHWYTEEFQTHVDAVASRRC